MNSHLTSKKILESSLHTYFFYIEFLILLRFLLLPSLKWVIIKKCILFCVIFDIQLLFIFILNTLIYIKQSLHVKSKLCHYNCFFFYLLKYIYEAYKHFIVYFGVQTVNLSIIWQLCFFRRKQHPFFSHFLRFFFFA